MHHRMLLIYHDAWFATVTGVVITAIVALPLVPLLAGVLAQIRQALGMAHRHAWRRSVLDVGLVYGVGVPIWLTMLPGGNRAISLVPFRDLATMPPYEIVGNMLLLAAMALSCAIETCQYVLPTGRVASVDDVILNTAGAALAAWGGRAWGTMRAPFGDLFRTHGMKKVPTSAWFQAPLATLFIRSARTRTHGAIILNDAARDRGAQPPPATGTTD